MKKKLAIIYAFITLFCVLATTAQQSLPELDLTKETEAARVLVKSDIDFKVELDADGDGFTLTQGKFSDGTHLANSSRRFQIAVAAQEYLRNQIKDSVKIIQRKQESSVTLKGKTIYREEGMLMLKSAGSKGYIFYRYSLTDRYLEETFCDSLKHLLASEIWEKRETKAP